MKLHCILFITEATFLDLQDGVSSWVGWIRIQVRSRQKLFDEKWSKELQENNDFLFDHLSDFNLSVSLSLSLSQRQNNLHLSFLSSIVNQSPRRLLSTLERRRLELRPDLWALSSLWTKIMPTMGERLPTSAWTQIMLPNIKPQSLWVHLGARLRRRQWVVSKTLFAFGW